MKHFSIRLAAILLCLALLLPSVLIPGLAAGGYDDVPDESWYTEAVIYVTEHGYMEGVSEGQFAPGVNVNRAMFVTVLARMAGVKVDDTKATAFTDVSTGKWYSGAIAWAAENGIVNGVSETSFAPTANISRQDLCTIIARFINVMQYDLPAKEAKTFSDSKRIASYAKSAVQLCTEAGLVAGYEDGTFRPKGKATRAQVAMIIMRLDQALAGQIVDPIPMPVQYFDGEAGNKMSVSVYAPEGALPENSTMATSPVTDEATLATIKAQVSGDVLAAADISFLKDEVEIEPCAEVEVLISVKNVICTDNLHVYHMKADNTLELVDSELFDVEAGHRGGSDKTVRFFAKDFSVYAVVDDPTPVPESRVKVRFWRYDVSGTTKEWKNHATVFVKNSDVMKPEDPSLWNNEESYIQDICPDPGIGDLDGSYIFTGWYIDEARKEGGTGADYTAETPKKTIQDVWQYLVDEEWSEGDEINIYAMCYKYFLVTFFGEKDAEGNELVLGFDTVLYLDSDTTAPYTPTMPYTSTNQNASFMGWLADDENGNANIQDHTEGKVYPNNQRIILTGDVEFRADAPEGFWLIFESNGKGATYVAPRFIKGGDKTEQPTIDMHRIGYVFGGWYELNSAYQNEDGTPNSQVPKDSTGSYTIEQPYFSAFEFEKELDKKTTVYAKWTSNQTANYTIIFWTENLDRNGYDLAGSYVGSGTVGESIPYTFVPNQAENYVQGAFNNNGTYYDEESETKVFGRFRGMCLVEADEALDVKIKAENDAVLNLHFDRIEYNLKFYLYRTQGNTITVARDSANGQNVWGIVSWDTAAAAPTTSYTLSHEPVGNYEGYYFTIHAFYGQDISEYWPQYSEIGNVTVNGETRVPVSYVMMVGTKLKPNPSNGGDGTVKGLVSRLDYNILGATNDPNGNFLIVRFRANPYNWRYHIWYEAINGNVPATALDQRQYNGKTYYKDTVLVVRSSNNDVGQQNAPKYMGFATAFRRNENWNGQTSWITGSGTTADPTLYNINYVYDRISYQISFFDGAYVGGNNEPLDNRAGDLLGKSDSIEQGANVSGYEFTYEDYEGEPLNKYEYGNVSIQCPEAGYVFEGWYVDEGCNEPYDFTTMPVGGIQVHAKWRKIQYRVFLHPNADNYTDLDWGSADQAMCFRISHSDKVSLPEGYTQEAEFIGWFMADGTPFDEDVVKLTETFVKEIYNKVPDAEGNVDYTDVINKFGHVLQVGDTLDNGDENTKAPYNSDLTGWDHDNDKNVTTPGIDRYWVTRKMELYAEWSEHLPGATGIHVVYDVGDHSESEINDDLLYRENAKASSQAAPDLNVDDIGKWAFKYWVVQTWDNDQGKFVDSDITVFPGETFNVKRKDAHMHDVVYDTDEEGNPLYDEQGNPKIKSAVYTVSVRAEYEKLSDPELTHIVWHGNGGKTSAGEKSIESEGVRINENITIQPADAFIKPGYKFLGWARLEESENGEPITLPEEIETLDATNLWLVYHPAQPAETDANGNPTRAASDAYWTLNDPDSEIDPEEHILAVAADEKWEYHTLYAVWGLPDCFYVFHSSSGKLEAIPVEFEETGEQQGQMQTKPYDLTALVADNHLYGGYYKTYGGVDTSLLQTAVNDHVLNKLAGWTASTDGFYNITERTGVGGSSFEAYDGSSLKTKNKETNVKFWEKNDAYTDQPGNALRPTPGVIYYLKEVPADYLTPKFVYIYDFNQDNKLINFFEVTAVDDNNYSSIGFSHGDGANDAALIAARDGTLTVKDKLATSFKVVQSGNDLPEDDPMHRDPVEIRIDAEKFGLPRCYVAVKEVTSTVLGKNGDYTYALMPSWETLDGVKVDGRKNVSITIPESNKITITAEPTTPAGNPTADPLATSQLGGVAPKGYFYFNVYNCQMWNEAHAVTKAYLHTSSTLMDPVKRDGNLYLFKIPEGESGMNILRLNPNGDLSNLWSDDTRWNQTDNVTITAELVSGVKNCIDLYYRENDRWLPVGSSYYTPYPAQ